MTVAGGLSNFTGGNAAGWSALAGSSTGTRNLAVQPRDDGLPGNQLVMTFTGLTGGSAAELDYVYQLLTVGTTPGVSAGNTIFMQCEVEVINPQQVFAVSLAMSSQVTDGNWNIGALTAEDTTTGTGLPNGVNWTGVLRTPDVTIPATGTTTFYPTLEVTLNASGTPATGMRW